MGELRLVNDEDVRRAAAEAEHAAAVHAAAISRALDERGAASPAGGRLLPEAVEVRANTAADRLRRRVERMAERARDRAARGESEPADPPDEGREAPDPAR